MTDSHTALPWKVVSDPHFDSGLVYTSIQPVNVEAEAMKPLAMMNGEFHVARMSHTAAPWRYNYHRANAAFIVEACNSFYQMREEIERLRALLSLAGDYVTDAIPELEAKAKMYAAYEASARHAYADLSEARQLHSDITEALKGAKA